MTDEEKEAIEYIKNIKNWWWNNSPDRIYALNKTDIEQFDIALNYIEKLQKENEELKKDNSHQWEERCRLTFELERLQKENQELKEKIKEYEIGKEQE